jgi:hypothetical protein
MTGIVGGPAFLQAQLVAGPDPVPGNGVPAAYTAGLVITTYNGTPVIAHSGLWEGFTSALVIEPITHRAAAVICNGNFSRSPDYLAVLALDSWFGT